MFAAKWEGGTSLSACWVRFGHLMSQSGDNWFMLTFLPQYTQSIYMYIASQYVSPGYQYPCQVPGSWTRLIKEAAFFQGVFKARGHVYRLKSCYYKFIDYEKK